VAKRCRAAAGARNKALHAQWGEITLQDVEKVIALTRELKLPRFRGVVLDLGDYGSVVTASIAAS
jgi:hypothetical protein